MVKTDSNIRSSYKLYKKASDEPVDVKDYINIANGCNQFIINKVVEGDEVVLPSRMGILSIVGKKRKVRFDAEGKPLLPIDWVKTKELWNNCEDCKDNKQVVYMTNDHTNGISYKFFWSKKRTLIQNKTLYSLRMTRDNKRKVHRAIVNNNKEYFVKQ